MSFINVGVSSFTWEMLLVMRHSLSFTHAAFLPFRCTRRIFNKFPLRGDANPTVEDGVGSRVGFISFVTFLRDLYRVNATRLAPHIRSAVGGHFLYSQTL